MAAGWGRFFFSRFMDLAFFSVPSVIDSVASTPPPPPPPPREKPLSWNGQSNTGKSLCMEIFNLQVFLHQYRGSFYIWRLVWNFVNT